jgi:putative SOS response-associated peptidase YedK
LWSAWNDPETDERLLTCTILTGSPNPLLDKIHDRMPIIMPPDRWDAWLDPSLVDKETIQGLMTVYPAGLMDRYAVSTLVNKVQNDSIDLITPLKTPIVDSL